MQLGIDLGGMYEPPGYYLDQAEKVEAAGFHSLWFGDHLQPWFHTDGHAPFAWSWLGAALERTESIPIGVFVTPPLYRYHPLVIANATATLDEMYPGRFRLGVGTGERMNEHPFVDEWPSWSERADRMEEAIDIIRTYWSSDDFFGYDGEHFVFKPIYPYEQPEQEMPIYFAATGPRSARLAAEYGDHLITIAGVPDVESRVVRPYRDHGGDGDVVFQSVGGFGDKERLTDRIMDSFASTVLPENLDESDPRELQASTKRVSREDVNNAFLIAESPDDVIRWIGVQESRGADHVVITDVSYEQDEFYRVAADEILPSI
ncbi:TIGR03557 family F420-dependent LLM class oxidoreductase [Haladaptatus salinisoli]|uniref:TIGR03557 family F420-dependent LLM class oxidoreductase n=1 Tax=Haladaptatus salinisoli TaxID=2884876 RepID=UPI001D0AC466|nr:TIGR03557 family F420-dependent LLM class oxidoreductase [Haladaptatus salinisoli]